MKLSKFFSKIPNNLKLFSSNSLKSVPPSSFLRAKKQFRTSVTQKVPGRKQLLLFPPIRCRYVTVVVPHAFIRWLLLFKHNQSNEHGIISHHQHKIRRKPSKIFHLNKSQFFQIPTILIRCWNFIFKRNQIYHSPLCIKSGKSS